MQKTCNVLQFKFFHVGGKGVESIEDVLVECAERVDDYLPLAMAGNDIGPGIKTVVRIYDTDGCLTRLVLRINELEAERESYIKVPRRTFLYNWYVSLQIERIDKKIAQIRNKMVDYFTNYIASYIHDGDKVAREVDSHRFRPARGEEYMDLYLTAGTAKHFWLIVFEPNDLLADKNKIIVSVM